jgi:UDP-N-acetylbacillosamine transaminase
MGGNEEKYVKNVFESNYIAPTGEFVDRLEEEICRYTGSKSAAALASGTAAIHLALRLAGAGAGDKVLVSTLTFIGSVSPVLYQNAQPVFIDSDRSWNLDPALLEKAIAREKPKALIVTHLYGQSADMERISEI